MEIDDTIFQDLGSFGKGRIFKMAMEKLWIFVWENSRISLNGFNTVYVLFVHFTICSIKHNSP